MMLEVMMSPDRERTLLERCLEFVDGNRSILADDDYPVCIGCAGSLAGGEEHHANCNTFDLYIALRDAVKAEREREECMAALAGKNTFASVRFAGVCGKTLRRFGRDPLGNAVVRYCSLPVSHEGGCEP